MSISAGAVSYWLLAGLLLGFLIWTLVNGPLFAYSLNNDFWEHSAVIREWMRDLWNPGNPHLNTEIGTPRYTPYYFLLTAIGIAFSIDSISVLTFSALLNISIFLIGAYLFFRAYFESEIAPSIGLIVLLTCWGTGWAWSSVYQLRSLMYVSPYPSTFAFAMTFVCLWLQIGILKAKTPSLYLYVLLSGIVALTFASHPFNGAFTVITLILLASLHPGARIQARVAIFLSVLFGVCLTELWPYYSVFKVTLGNSGGDLGGWTDPLNLSWETRISSQLSHSFYNPKVVLLALGPGLAGILCLGFLFRERAHRFIVAGAFIMLVPYIVNLFVRVPLGHRFLIFSVFYLHLAIIWAISEGHRRLTCGSAAVKSPAMTKIALVVISLAVAVGFLFNTSYAIFDARTRISSDEPISESIGKVVRFVPHDRVVMAQTLLAWAVPTFGGKVISLFHPNPMVGDATQRGRDVDIFFKADTPSSIRAEILRKYDVSFALIDTGETPIEVQLFLSSRGIIKDQVGNFKLFEFQPASTVND